VSALAEVIAGLRGALVASVRSRQFLSRAVTALNMASGSFARSLEGSASQESAQIRELLVHARNALETAHEVLLRAEGGVRDYLDKIGARTASQLAAPDDGSPPALTRVEQLRRELPPPVVRGSGSKTHGRWIDPSGMAQPMVSGRDGLAHRVNEVLDEMGCPTLPVVASTDVELKLAVLMRDEGGEKPEMRNITVVINHRPCKGRLGCEGLVPVVLPEGYSLTVHAPNYRKRFTGGAQPWWR
jgi:hypothetical protein